MTTELSNLGISLNQPLYLYQQPMFSLTASIVLIIENGVLLIKKDDQYRFPGGNVKAGQESIQFAVVRYVKEQTGIMLKKDALIPVDFRSDPDRTKEKNVVDIGFACMPDILYNSPNMPNGVQWVEIDFERKCLMKKKLAFFMDHGILLERAVEIAVMMR